MLLCACKHDSMCVCVASYFMGQVLALCPGLWQTQQSLARLAGGLSVGGLAGGVGEGEEVGDGGWDGKVSAGSLGSGQVVSSRWSGQNSLILL